MAQSGCYFSTSYSYAGISATRFDIRSECAHLPCNYARKWNIQSNFTLTIKDELIKRNAVMSALRFRAATNGTFQVFLIVVAVNHREGKNFKWDVTNRYDRVISDLFQLKVDFKKKRGEWRVWKIVDKWLDVFLIFRFLIFLILHDSSYFVNYAFDLIFE